MGKKAKEKMSSDFEAHLENCRLCFKSLKNQREATAITPEIEQKFLEWIKIELKSTDFYSTIICKDCDATFKEFSDFQFKMFENQTRLYLHFEKQEKIDHDPVVLLEMLEPEMSFDDLEIKVEVFDGIELLEEIDPPQKSKPPKRKYVKKDKIKTKQEPPPKFQKIIIRCELCSSEFDTNKEYNKHMRKDHVDPISTKARPGVKICPFCFKEIYGKRWTDHIRAHRLMLTNNPYRCDHCDYTGFYFKNILEHMLNSHSYGGQFKCTKCDKIFMTPSQRKIHFGVAHRDQDKKYPCKSCDIVFDNYHQMYTHRVKVHEKGEYECSECGKILPDREVLRYHYVEEHTAKKNCYICGEMVPNGKKFGAHLRRHKNRDNKTKCTFEGCNKEFLQPRNLLIHFQSVHGEKNFDCPTCDASFKSEFYLKRHIARHNPDRVQCRVPGCTHSSTRRAYLKLHYNSHRDIDEKFRQKLIKDLKKIKMLA